MAKENYDRIEYAMKRAILNSFGERIYNLSPEQRKQLENDGEPPDTVYVLRVKRPVTVEVVKLQECSADALREICKED